ncbi:hypothetical protein AXX17_AT1G37610 [Arabidopsis thaliana]|uniref:Uncharacterized protein n=3 Tax=Arabidopsis thaliana TaxID=3702 RepID=Q1G3E6_ARATH|nr:unknown protein [Arabidopsis thaliana]OAP16435.1 hypothetical protein AXX17_AT1G37610 [Arabidopsis thaliana]
MSCFSTFYTSIPHTDGLEDQFSFTLENTHPLPKGQNPKHLYSMPQPQFTSNENPNTYTYISQISFSISKSPVPILTTLRLLSI